MFLFLSQVTSLRMIFSSFTHLSENFIMSLFFKSQVFNTLFCKSSKFSLHILQLKDI